jgi:hypothetical protein
MLNKLRDGTCGRLQKGLGALLDKKIPEFKDTSNLGM